VQAVRLPLLPEGHPEGPHSRQAQPKILNLRPQLTCRGRPTGSQLAQPRRNFISEVTKPRRSLAPEVPYSHRNSSGPVGPDKHR